MLSDFRTDSNEILKALQAYTSVPVIGGLAGDTHIKLEECFLYANGEVLVDSIVMLAIEGELEYEIQMAHNLKSIGHSGIVTESEGLLLKKIDNLPVMDFIEQELGKPVELVDNGVITFKVRDNKDSKETRLRSVVIPDNNTSNELSIFGAVNKGEYINVCIAEAEDLIEEVENLGDSLKRLPFNPQAAIIVSCAGRKQLLGNQNGYEVSALVNKQNSPEAIVGFASMGEFGPVKNKDGYSGAQFHNMTYILLLLG